VPVVLFHNHKKQNSMVTIIDTHEVKDFNSWKQSFEAGAEIRSRAGVTLKNLYRHADNQNKVTIILEMTDVASAKAFITNLKPIMEKSGVIGDPQFMILDKVQ
jgi:hypothetical protein